MGKNEEAREAIDDAAEEILSGLEQTKDGLKRLLLVRDAFFPPDARPEGEAAQ